MSIFDKKPITCSYGSFFVFSHTSSLFVWNRWNWMRSKRIVWQNGKRTHTLGQTEKKKRKKIEKKRRKKQEHAHGCAQVYVNAHLYCTKIRWNELLMKLKYMPMKSRCQRAQHPSLRQSSEMKRSCCQNAGPLLKVPVRQFDGKNKMHKKFIYTHKS